MTNKSEDWSQSETAKYFEWVIIARKDVANAEHERII